MPHQHPDICVIPLSHFSVTVFGGARVVAVRIAAAASVLLAVPSRARLSSCVKKEALLLLR